MTEDDDLLPEYDLTKLLKGGVRGKYAERYRAGHTVKIHKEDGTTEIHHFHPEAGAVILEPDVRAYFPDSDSVNEALRGLIRLIPRPTPSPEGS